MGRRSTTRQFGDLVVVDEETKEEIEKYDVILPAEDERVCPNHFVDDGNVFLYVSRSFHGAWGLSPLFSFPDGYP